MTVKNTDELFDQIEQFIAECRAMLDSGGMLEMQGLDDQVRSLCETVLQLSPQERAASTGRMEKLLADLKELSVAMVESREQLAGEIRQLSKQKKAATAYKIVDASDGYGERKPTDED